MKSPQRSLHPAGRNDRRTFLSALELAAGNGVQFSDVVGTIVGQGMAFEPGPEVLLRIEVLRIRQQECDLDVAAQAGQVLSYGSAAMRFQIVPYDEQRLFQVSLERLQELDDLFLLDAALVPPRHSVGARVPGYDRDVGPAEVKLDDGCLPLRCLRAYPGWALADAGLVHKDNQAAFSLGIYVRAGQVLRFQLRTASS